MSKKRIGSYVALFLAAGLTHWAHAQPCAPAWETTIGNPGIGTGYVGPITPWDDGTGETLFVGGSFTAIGGLPIRYLAKWDRPNKSWLSLGDGIGSSGFVTAMLPFDPGTGEELVVGGYFPSAGGVPGTQSLARWNGQRWASLDANLGTGSVWSLAEWRGKLYVGGGFTSIGGLFTNCIAAWDGRDWTTLANGVTGSFSPTVFALRVFDDGSGEALYVGGRFDDASGVPGTSWLARWDGAQWSKVGGGLTPGSSLFGIEAMVPFDDGRGPALYVAGYEFYPPNLGPVNVARWNGQTWEGVGQRLGGRTTSLAVFNDGDGARLYNGGGWQPDTGYLSRFENGQWTAVGGGLNNSIFGLRTWETTLYIGGNFTAAGGEAANGLVARTSCVGDLNCDGTIDFGDINPFVLALSDPNEYRRQYPDCKITYADVNSDGRVDFGDINPFVELLSGQ